MSSQIKINLTNDNLIIKLNEEASQKEITENLKKKINDLKKLYKDAKTPILVTGKNLSESEKVEIKNIIPSCDEVKKKVKQYGLDSKEYIPLWLLLRLFFRKKTKRLFYFILKSFFTLRWRQKIKYPVVGAYSDILLLPQNIMNQFVNYCGAFAASDMFVELAIPTSLIMCSDTIVTGKDLLLSKSLHSSKDDFSILDKYHFSYDALEQNFPKNHLFLHPIKLSKWKKEK